ncbi:hypothetical protein J3R83DRAFT_8724 [Lanmaoa asiatica]|nr:hypothetical protein J3R83DRAFT_8724 [Lanmaoa asiatica]
MSVHPHDQVAALKVAISTSISLALMIVDFGWLMRDEVKYIWPRLRAASQIFNVYFTVRMYLGVYTSPAGCRLWFVFQALVVQFLLASVEGMLMHRVYALFIRSRLVLLILILFALGQTASMVRNNYDDQRGDILHDLLAISPVTCELDAARHRMGRLPGFGMVVGRDISDADIDRLVMMMFLTLCSLEVIKPSMSGNITYYWLVCVLWVSIGRIVVNHEKLPRDKGEQWEGNTWKGTLQLTSQLEMGGVTLTLDIPCGSSVRSTPTSTLQSSLPTPMTKASQLSPSDRTSGDAREWFGDLPLPHGYAHRHSPQLSNAPLPVDASVPKGNQLSSSSVYTRDDDSSRTVDHPQADADADAHETGQTPSPSPQPSSPEQPPSEVSS